MLNLATMASSSLALDQPGSRRGLQAGAIDLTMMATLMLQAASTRKDIEMNQSFNVQGMSCGHCVQAVTQAVKALDPAAEVQVDLGSGKVEVQSDADRAQLARAIADEGYTVAP
jgi:copper chaperone